MSTTPLQLGPFVRRCCLQRKVRRGLLSIAGLLSGISWSVIPASAQDVGQPPIVFAESIDPFSESPPSDSRDSASLVNLADSDGAAYTAGHHFEDLDSVDVGSSVVLEDNDSEDEGIVFGDWLGYNSAESDMTWLIGHGDDLGIFSLESYPTLEIGKESALSFDMGFHFVDGPRVTDLPPRLYDFQAAYHARKSWTEDLIVDFKTGVGVFSDFEGSARKGLRFPGHAVSYYQWHPWLVSVFGVEVLDRDDISLLPVGGAVWRANENWVFELVFPRPKVQFRLSPTRAFYVSGELGGGTWAIERSTAVNDNTTYRDLRLLFGLVDFEDGDSAFEFGWAFDRRLEYRSGLGNYTPDDAFFIRFRALY